MTKSDLIGGPYYPPPCRVGDWIDDVRHGRVQVGGFTSAPISWPRLKKTGKPSLILCGDLERAVRTESVSAICYWWDVGPTTVWAWRCALDIGPETPGTRKLRQDNSGVPPEAAALGRLRAASPESIAKIAEAKIAEAKRGSPAHPNTVNAPRPKPPGWGERANAWMLAAKHAKKR